MKMYDFDGKVAVITGAGSDMGAAIVKKFMDDGANAVLIGVHEETIRKTYDDLGLDKSRAICIEADVSDEAAVKAAVKQAVDTFGRIDYLVNLAGIEGPNNSRTEEYDYAMAKRVFDVNVWGTFLMMQNCLPVMQAQGSGAIVNFGSVSGMFGYAGEIAYGASKAAVIHITKNAANENGGNGVRVNCLSPGWVNTKMFRRILDQYRETFDDPLDNVTLGPLGRPAEPAEMANIVAFLCSDEASYVNGSNWLADGGMTLG
jgi:NAD(P)-dependent dehydrogenase (short-subunit alcohol dehydrogenase family)